MKGKTFISVAPPTPNGGLHLGHLSGPYVAADVYTRAERLQGRDCVFVSGTDDHQSYVETKGIQLGISPEEVVARFGKEITAVFDRARIEFDHFQRPSYDADYIQFVQAFVRSLVEKGRIVAKTKYQLYDEDQKRFLFESHVGGICPHCGSKTNGNGCEPCGLYNDSVDLIDPKSNRTGKPASVRQAEKLYLDLEEFRPELEKFHREVNTNTHLRAYFSVLESKPLPLVSASQIAPWGIPVGLPGFEGQVINEWIEMAAGYVYMADKLGGRDLYFKEGRTVQFFGFDNTFFYSTLLPATLIAYDPELRLPEAFVSNEFFLLEGAKFSTSRNHAVWALDALEVIPADFVRIYLSYHRPESSETNFTYPHYAAAVASEFEGVWIPWLESVEKKLQASNSDGILKRLPDESELSQKLISDLESSLKVALSSLDSKNFSTRKAIGAVCEMVRTATSYSQEVAHLQKSPGLRSEYEASLATEVLALKMIATAVSPIMPGFGELIAESLGTELKLSTVKDPISCRRLGELGSSYLKNGVACVRKFVEGNTRA